MLKHRNCSNIIYTVILIMNIAMFIVMQIERSEPNLWLVLLSISNCFTLCAYIQFTNKVIIGVIYLLLAQVSTLVYQIAMGARITDALGDLGMTFIITIIALIIYCDIAKKNIPNTDNKKLILKDILYYKRDIIKIPRCSKVILYSLLITTIMSLSRSEILNTLSADSSVRVFGAITLVLPLLLTLTMLTATDFSYQLLIIYNIMEVYTLYNLFITENIQIVSLISVTLDVIVTLYILNKLYKTKRQYKEIKKDIPNN